MTTDNSIQFYNLLQSAITEPGIISKAYSAFHGYSLGNMIAAACQCAEREIDIGPIASFNAWKEKGRSVIKGQKAIALCMPVTCKSKETDLATGEEKQFSYNRFVWKNNWFVLDQTEGEEFANEINIPQWNKITCLRELGIIEGKFKYLDGNTQGYASGNIIAVSPVAEYPLKTRFHEIAHVVLGHTAEHTLTDTPSTPRDIREVEAESVAFILCSLLDLPGKDESRGYIQSWLRGQTIPEKSAQKIFSTADKILKSGSTT